MYFLLPSRGSSVAIASTTNAARGKVGPGSEPGTPIKNPGFKTPNTALSTSKTPVLPKMKPFRRNEREKFRGALLCHGFGSWDIIRAIVGDHRTLEEVELYGTAIVSELINQAGMHLFLTCTRTRAQSTFCEYSNNTVINILIIMLFVRVCAFGLHTYMIYVEI